MKNKEAAPSVGLTVENVYGKTIDIDAPNWVPEHYTHVAIQALTLEVWEAEVARCANGAKDAADLHFRVGEWEWRGSLRQLMVAMDMLKELEWQYDTHATGGCMEICPICSMSQKSGHSPACRLAAALQANQSGEKS